jgi:tetratricopeptide (TPR) repeat protein
MLGLCSGKALAASTFESGLKQYNLGRYGHAVVYFSLAEEEEPRNALVHYYLANALVRTGHHEEAIVEYGLCYRLDPHGKVSNYCRQALTAYKQPLPSAAVPVHISTNSGALDRSTRFDGSGAKIGTTDEDELVARTESLIRQEVIFEKGKHRDMADSFASGALVQVEAEAKRIQDDAAREIEYASQPPPGGGKLVPMPSPEAISAKIEEIKRVAKERENNARRLAQARADRYKEWSQDRQKSLDEVASNLENQLTQPLGRSGVKLQPVGTDLYTRYYGCKRAANQLPDVKPAAVRIIDYPSGERAEEDKLQDGDLGSERIRTEKVVRGSVLH